ncbi:MAG: beta-ketoacyl-ACP synthase I [Planctomycetes bacterium]|nr:beta-ketoacyl-ACP synthase I [Planctomycetota bacterium]
MRRAVITGYGVISSIGNNKQEVTESLRNGTSGIEFVQEYCDKNFRSHVAGTIDVDLEAAIDRRTLRFMGDGSAYNYLAMCEALEHSGLEPADISNPRTGLVVGTGGSSTKNLLEIVRTFETRGARKIKPVMVSRIMNSTNSAGLATAFKIKGVNYTISSACATSAHCIGHGADLVKQGEQDIVFAGGGEELFWIVTVGFDCMGALSSDYNDTPQRASRPYDRDRDGFVMSGGGGLVVIEEYEHAKARGAAIHAEIVGYGATSDGVDMVVPSGEGAVRCMHKALEAVQGPVQYINTHGTSTPAGDIAELGAIREVFGDQVPYISSTKSLTGHGLGAAGVNEAIYCLLMLKHDFLAASANIENIDPAAADFPILRERLDNAQLRTVMSNSFGFGGTNACLVLQKV